MSYSKKRNSNHSLCRGSNLSGVLKGVYPPNLELEPNHTTVFAMPFEFALHHSKGKVNTPKKMQELMVETYVEIRDVASKS